MKYMLSNGIIEAVISAVGAELQSLRRVSAPTEYLWQGDAAYWDRRSPILFPVCGTLWKHEAHVHGKTYQIGQHGFLRDMVFELTADEDRHLRFTACSDAESMKLFPYDFEVDIDYTLLRSVLTVGWTVRNKSRVPMPFQIGAHPGFFYPKFDAGDAIHGYLSFDVASPLISTSLSGPFVIDDAFEVPVPADGLLPLTDHTFDCDTIIEASGRVHRITLHDKEGRPVVTVKHDMPVTALWSPCGGAAPFMCIEPWHGCPDSVDFTDDFSRRAFTETVAPDSAWHTEYRIILE